MQIALHKGSQVLSTSYEVDAYMTTILEVRLRTCLGKWVEQKATPNSQPTSHEPTSIMIKHILISGYSRLTSLDSASMVGFGTRVIRPYF